MNRWFLDENDIDIYLKCTDDVRWHYNKKELVRILNDLEAKLAESEKLKENYDILRCQHKRLGEFCDELKQQLAEKEKEIDEVRSNHANLVADIAYKAVNVYTAESKKTGVPTFYKIHYSQLLEIEDMGNLRNYAQDKISFAVEQLEKVLKHFVYCGNEIVSDYSLDCEIDELKAEIDSQIKAIKGDEVV